MSLVSLAVLPLLLIAANVFKNKVKASFQAVRNAVSKLNAFVQEHIQGMQIVQVFGVKKQEFEKFNKINKEHTQANIDGIMAYSIFYWYDYRLYHVYQHVLSTNKSYRRSIQYHADGHGCFGEGIQTA